MKHIAENKKNAGRTTVSFSWALTSNVAHFFLISCVSDGNTWPLGRRSGRQTGWLIVATFIPQNKSVCYSRTHAPTRDKQQTQNYHGLNLFDLSWSLMSGNPPNFLLLWASGTLRPICSERKKSRLTHSSRNWGEDFWQTKLPLHKWILKRCITEKLSRIYY